MSASLELLGFLNQTENSRVDENGKTLSRFVFSKEKSVEDFLTLESSQIKDRLSPPEISGYTDALLQDEELTRIFENLRSVSEYINWEPGISIEEKSDRFKNSYLFELVQKMESEASELNLEELGQIESLNEKFNEEGSLFEKLFEETIKTVLDFQRIKLTTDAEEKVDSETVHIKGVTRITFNSFPNNKLLTLISSVHDAFKHLSNTRMELSLHELLNTLYSPEILEKTLSIIAKEKGVDLNEDELNAFKKLARRVIFTHGNEEFPEFVSFMSPVNPDLGTYCLVIKEEGREVETVYYRTFKRSVPREEDHNLDQGQEISFDKKTIAQMNACDMAIGSELSSFVKYNLFYESIFIAGLEDFYTYIEDSIFRSFESNLKGSAANLLLKQKDTQLLSDFMKKTRIVGDVFKTLFESSVCEEFESKNLEKQKNTINNIAKKLNLIADLGDESGIEVCVIEGSDLYSKIYKIISAADSTLKAFDKLKEAVLISKENITSKRRILNTAFDNVINLLNDLVQTYKIKV